MRQFKDSKTNKMKERKHSRAEYLQKKQRKLSSEATQQIRGCLKHGQSNVYELANEFGCVPTQIAGIKARLKS